MSDTKPRRLRVRIISDAETYSRLEAQERMGIDTLLRAEQAGVEPRVINGAGEVRYLGDELNAWIRAQPKRGPRKEFGQARRRTKQ